MSEPTPIAGQGRLAQVIAARGGQAAPEAPFVIEHREALIYMLCQAAELEHAIMCQYLFAAFSLKQSTDEGLTEAELVAVSRWRRQISHVATQEMLHLALVHNLLSAIGAAPHLARPNLPQPADHYPAGVQLALLPFGEQALRHFMFLERPEGMAIDDAEGLAAHGAAIPIMVEGDIVPRLQDFATVGHLYRSIEAGLHHLADKLGEQRLFIGPVRAQATATHFSWPELVTVTDLASACRAIEEILEQGEGPRGQWRAAHFGQFVAILEEYQQARDANPSFDPVRPVLVANVRPCARDSSVPLLSDPVTARCADLFNVAYEILLQALERYFAHTEETDAQLATLADLTVSLMLRVIKPLGELITTLPAGPDHPGQTAGPSFELFYENDYLMPHREAAWVLLEERLREAVEFCRRIAADAAAPVAQRLAPVGAALDQLADTLGAHLPDSGDPVGPESTGEPAATNQAALLTRAAELKPTVDPGPGLFTAVYEVLRTDAAALSGVAQRLVASVLRPLADGGVPTTGLDSAVAIPPAGPAHERLQTLAKAATRLRSRPGAAPELIEATAALQDLAVRLAPDETEAAAQLDELRAIQAGLAAGIQSMTDGPYLITNAETMTNHLGERIPHTPTMALCRCGASAGKPFCDGSHATIGFAGAKDPSRVPDRRDTYPGVGVTVLDNRGICAHSGFCTDRLATVFHAGSEPFVTPSGGRADEITAAVRACPSGALSYAIDGREAREQVDLPRTADIEVSKDGPYRITGALPLTDGDGSAEARAAGASTEHYSLCRCGHSQNKPFCSGMHWYVDFTDPAPAEEPTLFEWAGGLPALLRTTQIFYQKYVPADPLLAPLFAQMSPDHPARVAAWLGEVFGGPKLYSQTYGGYPRMISQHVGKGLTEAQRARWVTLLSQSATDAGLPADPEFRAAFSGYLEWGSRLAVENSQTTSRPPANMPMPRWWWVCNATPGSRISALDGSAEAAAEPLVLPGPAETVSFAAHVKPLFRARDRQSMRFAFDLWSYPDVAANADAILDQIRAGSMPCDGAWPAEQIEVLARWIDGGKAE
ncbi:MAG TPA: ferritin-like domain-containing protein [Pseudonocardiaceae bacterium]|jgi:CDGSH-type Zn-finger protein|nr:ferritin-like domain-containing protein [Pseudonocardiaceae bacterium]